MANLAEAKRSPIVLIRTLTFIEVLSFAAYMLGTGHNASKLDLYNRLFFSDSIPYQTAKIVLLFGVQLAIIIYAFLNWYREAYVVRPRVLIHRWGVVFHKEKSVPLDKSMVLTTSSGPLGKILRYGSVRVLNPSSGQAVFVRDVPRPAEFMRALEQGARPEKFYFQDKPDIKSLLTADEHEGLEFKSSLRFDRAKGQVNRELERAVMKTVAAFLNTRGGHIILGVSDKRDLVGLAEDYQSIQHPTQDGFENHFTQAFNSMLGPEFRHLVKLWFENIGGKDVCLVQVAPSSRPAYLKFDNNEQFFVRTGNITTALKLSEVDSYRRSRWPRRTVSA